MPEKHSTWPKPSSEEHISGIRVAFGAVAARGIGASHIGRRGRLPGARLGLYCSDRPLRRRQRHFGSAAQFPHSSGVGAQGLFAASAKQGQAPHLRLSGTPDSLIRARRAADLCQVFAVPLRLATFVVRDKQMYPTGAGYKAENLVSNQLRLQAEAAQAQALADWSSSVSLTAAIGDGKTLKAAMDSLPWLDQELMIVGSSGRGPLLRAFLGSNLGKLVRAAPIPCICCRATANSTSRPDPIVS